MLELLVKLFGRAYVNKMIGTGTNIAKPIKFDKNSPFKLYSDSAFKDSDVLRFIEKKIAEYGPFALANRNASEVKNFEMNARRLLNAREGKKESQVKKAAEAMFGTIGKKEKPEAEIIDITTQEKVGDKGIKTLKSEIGLPEGVEPGSVADKAIKESAQYKMDQQGVKSLLDEDYKPSKTTTLEEDEIAEMNLKKDIAKLTEREARAYSANIEAYRRPIIREMLLKDTRINLPRDVRESLLMKNDLERGADPKMDPLKLLDEYYDVDFNKLDELEEIRFTARNETEAADEFLKKGGLKPKKPLVRESLDDEAVEVSETSELPDDDIPFATGGRVGFKFGTGKEGIKSILNMMNKKFGKGAVKTADEVTLTNDMVLAKETKRALEELKDYKDIAPQFYQRMTLKLKYPGISDELIAKIMADDDPQRVAEVMATMDEAFKMMDKGMSSDEILKVFKTTPRTKNAGGGLNYLMGM